MKAIVTGGRAYVDNGALRFTLDCLRAFAWSAARGYPPQPLSFAHGACGWDLHRDGPVPPQAESAAYLRFIRKLKGADAVAHLYALEHGLEVRPYPADWSQGPSGGPKRNRHMFHVEQPHVTVAAPGDRGTADMCRVVREAGALLWQVEPWRVGLAVAPEDAAPEICGKCHRAIPPTVKGCVCEVLR